MNKTILGIVVLVLVAAGGWYFYQSQGARSAGEQAPAGDNGTYLYICDNGSTFSMTPSLDVSSIKLEAGSQGMFTGTATLMQATSSAGARYEGTYMNSKIVFVGAGEGVRLSVGSESTTCNPKPSQEMAPWNWGDPAEGGSVKPDVIVVVSESIVGKWKSDQDPKFMREFKDDGTVVDWYDNKVETTGTFKVFTKDKPLTVAFPLDANATYLQLKMAGSQSDTLNFKVSKLTPEVLNLTYMDRGGVQTYTLVK